MAGEVLMCVWEAACSVKGRGLTITKDTLKKVLQDCTPKEIVNFREKGFENAFPKLKVEFSDFKRYALISLKPADVNHTQFEDNMERCCLNQALSGSGYKGLPTDHSQFEEIWRIFIRLAHGGSYPPVVSGANVKWILEYYGGQSASITDNNNQEDILKEMTFSQFLKFMSKSADSSVIQNMYTSVVKEAIQVKELPCREKKADDWEVWEKFKVAMCYGKLELYYEKIAGKPARVFYIDSKSISTKVKPDAFSASKKLKHRLQLTVQNVAEVGVQLAFSTDEELEDWQRAFQNNVKAMVSGNRPMIQELQRRPSDPDTGKRSSLKNENPQAGDSDQGLKETEIKEKIRTVFLGIDKDGNGLMDKDEFKTMIRVLEVDIDDEQLDLVFGIIDMDGSGSVAFEEFYRYMMMVVGLYMSSTANGEDDDMHIVKAFRQADNGTRGILDFKEFIEFMISAGQIDRIPPAIKMFQECDTDGNGTLEFEQFRDIFVLLDIRKTELVTEKERNAQLMLKDGLRKICRTADTSKIAAFLEERWKKFSGLKRYDKQDNLLMEGGDLVKDLLPGSYKLTDLAFFNAPKILPKHIVAVEGTQWRPKKEGEKSGELTFLGQFDGVVPTALATPENLSYYNCTFAGQSDKDYTIVYRHGVIDFDYSSKYLEEYVMQGMGGSGIEKHGFDHLDCPLDDDSGVMVIGKYVDDDTLHLTGFIVPKHHTVFVPAGTVHSNDYLRGTWRTMLSDEADIDHVQFVRYENGKKKHFHFTFTEV